MPVAGLLGNAHPARGAVVQPASTRSSTRACTPGWAWRRRTATASASAGTASRGPAAPLPSTRDSGVPVLFKGTGSGLERRQPAGARALDVVRPLHRPHPREHRDGRAADELPPLQVRPLAVGAQRRHQGLPRDEARPRDGGRPRALPVDRGVHGLRGHVLPRPDVRPARGPGRRGRAHGGLRRGDGTRARRGQAHADDGRDERRRAALRLPATPASARAARCTSAPPSPPCG